MSFDLTVFALDGAGDAEAVRAMTERCLRNPHPEGDLDPRIVGFYEALRAQFPDHPPYPAQSPWALMPLSVGIDHVFMHLSHGEASDAAIDAIERLARHHRLVLWDPQSDSVYPP